jgi:transcriptional regulator with XRE-family HTH domain
MADSKETLASFVRRIRRDRGYSTRTVAVRSGHGISDGYVSRIESGYVTNPSPKIIRALAKGLGIEEDAIFSVIRGQLPKTDELDDFYGSALYELYQRRKRASPEDQRLIDEYIEMVLDRIKRRRSPSRKRKGGA